MSVVGCGPPQVAEDHSPCLGAFPFFKAYLGWGEMALWGQRGPTTHLCVPLSLLECMSVQSNWDDYKTIPLSLVLLFFSGHTENIHSSSESEDSFVGLVFAYFLRLCGWKTISLVLVLIFPLGHNNLGSKWLF